MKYATLLSLMVFFSFSTLVTAEGEGSFVVTRGADKTTTATTSKTESSELDKKTFIGGTAKTVCNTEYNKKFAKAPDITDITVFFADKREDKERQKKVIIEAECDKGLAIKSVYPLIVEPKDQGVSVKVFIPKTPKIKSLIEKISEKVKTSFTPTPKTKEAAFTESVKIPKEELDKDYWVKRQDCPFPIKKIIFAVLINGETIIPFCDGKRMDGKSSTTNLEDIREQYQGLDGFTGNLGPYEAPPTTQDILEREGLTQTPEEAYAADPAASEQQSEQGRYGNNPQDQYQQLYGNEYKSEQDTARQESGGTLYGEVGDEVLYGNAGNDTLGAGEPEIQDHKDSSVGSQQEPVRGDGDTVQGQQFTDIVPDVAVFNPTPLRYSVSESGTLEVNYPKPKSELSEFQNLFAQNAQYLPQQKGNQNTFNQDYQIINGQRYPDIDKAYWNSVFDAESLSYEAFRQKYAEYEYSESEYLKLKNNYAFLPNEYNFFLDDGDLSLEREVQKPWYKRMWIIKWFF